jgi:aerobic carbon-monoxide dehydrogenase large subunit
MKFGIGQSVTRLEDQRLVTGRGAYTDDVQLPGMTFGATVRSPHGHARITSVDLEAALAVPGVLAIYTYQDIAYLGRMPCVFIMPNRDGTQPKAPPRAILAQDTVRYVGEPVAFVVADSRAAARAGADAVMVGYDPLPALADLGEALAAGAPSLWPSFEGNVANDWETGNRAEVDAAFAKAAKVARVRVVNNRVAPTSMEVRAAVGQYSEEDGYTLWVGSQGVAGMRGILSGMILKEKPDRVRLITGDVGGGFGMKVFVYPEYVLALHAAKHLGRPVKWTGDRIDAFLTDIHGRDMISDCEMALDADGHFLAMRVDTVNNLGAYFSTFGPGIQTWAGGRMVGGVYKIPAIVNRVRAIMTNTCPTDAYRGAGRPEATYLTERLVEEAARVCGISSDEIRRRNLLKPSDLPYASPIEPVYDVGDFPGLLETALEKADWNGFSSRQAQSRADGKLRGRGIGFYVEIAGGGSSEEFADMKFMPDGMVNVAVGTQSNGQGHETSYAQVVSDRLGIDIENVKIVQGDTDRLEVGHGTGGSRSMAWGGSASLQAANQAVELGTALAQKALDTAEIDFRDGLFTARGTNRSISLFELAARYPGELDTRARFAPENPRPTYPNGCHIAEVEIDPETGVVKVVRYEVVDDFGTLINPLLVQGQIHGGVAQGLGQALLENVVYGEGAQLLTASFMDYGVPRADDMPWIDFTSRPTPSPTNPLGVKGCGEAGTIGAMPSIINAILNALAPLGVTQLDMPATPQTVWQAIQAVKQQAAA